MKSTKHLRELVRHGDVEGKFDLGYRLGKGPKTKHWAEQIEISPDGKRKVRVTQSSAGEDASTIVTIDFPKANGATYGTKGIYPDIEASWKDNHTIVIETRKDFIALVLAEKMDSLSEILSYLIMDLDKKHWKAVFETRSAPELTQISINARNKEFYEVCHEIKEELQRRKKITRSGTKF